MWSSLARCAPVIVVRPQRLRGLTSFGAAELRYFRRDGYVKVSGVLSEHELEAVTDWVSEACFSSMRGGGGKGVLARAGAYSSVAPSCKLAGK